MIPNPPMTQMVENVYQRQIMMKKPDLVQNIR